MGLMMRRRRPLVRLAAGAAVAGTAYHMGKKSQRQAQINEEAEAAYTASQQAPVPEYAPPTQPTPSSTTDLDHLVQLHASGALDDQEFAAAKAQLLGL
jgi:uncharacterized membrane protein YebE (DUF533 family)